MRLLGGRGASASLMSLTLKYCGEQQRRGQEAYMIFGVVDRKASVLLPFIWLLNCQQNIVLILLRKCCVFSSEAVKAFKAFKASKGTLCLGVLFIILPSDAVYTR